MADTKPAVSFIGLGAMGFGMATNLVKLGYTVTGFDVWAPTLQRFKDCGGQTATTPAEAAAGRDLCVIMVATAAQAHAVLLEGPDAAVPALPRGAALLLCSTVSCQDVQRLESQLADAGRGDVLLVDCPVSGGAARAADGTLSIMAGGSDEALAKAKSLLADMSAADKLYIVAGGIGAGSNMKMVHQVLAANQILLASEAMGFADRLGLDLTAVQKAVLEGDTWNFMFEHRSPRMFSDYQPIASAVQIITKDTSIITSEGRRTGFPTLMTSAAEQVYFAAFGRGYALDDDSSLIRLYTEGKGKVGPVKGLVEADGEKLELVLGLLRGILLCSAAECLAFAADVKLDLEQVLDLCVNAAGGSRILQTVGPAMIGELRGGGGAADGQSQLTLKGVTAGLKAAVDEAQRLKTPVFLGSQALNLLQKAALLETAGAAIGVVVKAWTRA